MILRAPRHVVVVAACGALGFLAACAPDGAAVSGGSEVALEQNAASGAQDGGGAAQPDARAQSDAQAANDAAVDAGPLFADLPAAQSQALELEFPLSGAEVRQRFVTVDHNYFRTHVLDTTPPTPVILNCFPDVTRTAVTKRLRASSSAGTPTTVWIATFVEDPIGELLVTVYQDGRMSGQFDFDHYALSFHPLAGHAPIYRIVVTDLALLPDGEG